MSIVFVIRIFRSNTLEVSIYVTFYRFTFYIYMPFCKPFCNSITVWRTFIYTKIVFLIWKYHSKINSSSYFGINSFFIAIFVVSLQLLYGKISPLSLSPSSPPKVLYSCAITSKLFFLYQNHKNCKIYPISLMYLANFLKYHLFYGVCLPNLFFYIIYKKN